MPYKEPEKHREKESLRRELHREEINAARRATRHTRREKINADKRAWYAIHRERIITARRKARNVNLKEINAAVRLRRAKFRDRINAHRKVWYAMNIQQLKILAHRYVTRKKSLPALFGKKDLEFMLQYWGYACAVCGAQEGFEWTLALDHWIPLSSPQCPGTIAVNMLPLCHGTGGCNNSKRNKDGALWLQQRYGTRKANAILRKIQQYFALVREQGSTPRLTDPSNVA